MTTARRAKLADFAPPPLPPAEDAKVEVVAPPRRAAATPPEPTLRAEAPAHTRKKYPHLSVYLPAETIKQLKLIAIEHEVAVNDLCVEAITQWMAANGHARTPFKV